MCLFVVVVCFLGRARALLVASQSFSSSFLLMKGAGFELWIKSANTALPSKTAILLVNFVIADAIFDCFNIFGYSNSCAAKYF